MDSLKAMQVISVSGGKDSTATLLLALEKHSRKYLRFVFADTGNEHEAVYSYLDYLESALSIQIVRLKADFSSQIKRKRLFIARDRRKKIRWTNKAKRRALAVLHPTGIPYLDLCIWKGRFPSRMAQFCTQMLKTEPLIRYQHNLVDEGYTVVSWQGVRRDESRNRANVLQIEDAGSGIWQYRPIADWTAEDTFNMHKKYGIEPNPLYKQGMNRVGCMPCINCSKSELREIAKRFPEHIEKIREWEIIVSQAGKRAESSFFTNTKKSKADKSTIYKAVEWSKTTHGGNQYDLLAEAPPLACASAYGLCE